MTRNVRRALAACATVAVLAAGSPTPASAQAQGSLTVDPVEGGLETFLTFRTSGGCPAAATGLVVTIDGTGFGKGGENYVASSPLSIYGTAGGSAASFTVPAPRNLRDQGAMSQPPVVHYSGTYALVLHCRKRLGTADLATFRGEIRFGRSGKTWRLVGAPPAASRPTASPAAPLAGDALPPVAGAAEPSTGPSAAAASPGGDGGSSRLPLGLWLGLGAVGALLLLGLWVPPLARRRSATTG
ncbi:hypothetical protein [Motilibacter aurantiacus]|uniref:hypothetical protein n=1 Tax=Motilibacter aurantiacus TaxID=2714955 RepID=UPI00140D252E|nr:hypothetical protein [Motilibacter aurantiacus]NHC46875.1 hypothetical protein [Motilibacter aurantiacus]